MAMHSRLIRRDMQDKCMGCTFNHVPPRHDSQCPLWKEGQDLSNDWEKQFHKQFAWDLTESMENNIRQFIKSNFILREELREVLKKGHGGGNWRRLIIQLLD